MKNNLVLAIICIAGIVSHLIAYPFAQVGHADAVSRIFMAENWLDNPHLITSGIWLPFHHYLNALAIWISGEHVRGPIVMHILFGALTAIPIYQFTKREFSKNGAWFSAVLYVFCPVVFRNSFNPLSEVPFAFFVAMSIHFLSKSIKENNIKTAILAGLFATIAAGFRYEAWVLILVFAGICAYYKTWKIFGWFLSFAIIFPIFWMIGNYTVYHDMFYGLSGNDKYLIKMQGVNDQVTLVEKMIRFVFFPFSWFLNYFPLIAGLLLFIVSKRLIKREISISRFIWALPFFLLLALYTYKTFEGTLNIQHRFTVSLMVLSVPFASIIFEKNRWTLFKKILVSMVILSYLPMSYIWMKIPFEKAFSFSYSIKTVFRDFRYTSINEIQAIPRLDNQIYASFKDKIKENSEKKDGLILDFISWESTCYLALESGLHPKQIFMADGSKHGKSNSKRLEEILVKCPTGIIMLSCYSKFSELYVCQGDQLIFNLEQKISVKLTPLVSTLCVAVFKYKAQFNPDFTNISTNSCILGFPEKNSKLYQMYQIKQQGVWSEDVKMGIGISK